MLRGRAFLRFYSSDVAKSLLSSLRRRSGFPFMKCKEALAKHNNDLDAAEKWLHEQAQKEGWARVAKVQDRQAEQGLIGLAIDDNRAAMVEVNCETDFVARNDKFQSLVSTITRCTLTHLSPRPLTTTNLSSLDLLTSDSILNICDNEGGGANLADQVAETVGHLQEKIAIARGCTLRCSDGLLCAHVYNNQTPQVGDNQVGKYGVILHMTGEDSESLTARSDASELKVLGKQLCQHIVGANPKSIDEGPETLMSQSFLFDGSVTVGDLLHKNSIRVTRFVRYALGEKESNPWIN